MNEKIANRCSHRIQCDSARWPFHATGSSIRSIGKTVLGNPPALKIYLQKDVCTYRAGGTEAPLTRIDHDLTVALISDDLEPLALHYASKTVHVHSLTVCSVRYSNLTDPQKSFIYRNRCSGFYLPTRSDHEPTTMCRLSWPRAEIKNIPNDATHLDP